MIRTFAISLILMVSWASHAQVTVNGIVRSTAGDPLPFAIIHSGEGKLTADSDGRFILTTGASELVVSYPGHHDQVVKISQTKSFYSVKLALSAEPVSSRGTEIALRAIKAKAQNDPKEILGSFRVNGYTRLLVTANPDSIRGKIDTIRRYGILGRKVKIDSAQYKIKKMMERQHFFASEKSAVYEFDGIRFKETVDGTRMSGFREPLYEVLGLNFQSFSIYDNYYELMESKYLSPLAGIATRQYHYTLLDSMMVEGRKSYLVRFQSKRNRKSARPSGLLYIDAENYAVCGYVIRVRGILRVTGEQRFSWHDGFWFPQTRTFTIRKGNSTENIRILGETITFDADDSAGTRNKLASDFTELISVTYFSGLKYNIPVDINRSGVAIEVQNQAINRSDDFWKSVRALPPDLRELNTYVSNDSIVAEERIENKLRFGRKIINGYIPFGPIDLDLRQLISYNNFEGFRLGIGGVTNDRFSRIYRIESYTAYGTKDGKLKYHLGNALRIGQFSNTWIGASYTNDVREIASTSIATDKRAFKIYDPRPINVSTFYQYEQQRAFVETRIIPKTESIWQLSRNFVAPQFNYAFFDGRRFHDKFELTLASVAIQWNPFSDFMQSPAGRFETEKRFPKLAVQFTKSMDNFLGGDFDFNKIDLRAEYEIAYLDGQKSAAMIQAGLAEGDVPITHLYSTSPNNLNKDVILQRVTFAGKNSFETMYFNEFFSSRFVSLQLKHQFRSIRFSRQVKPSPVIVTRGVWGTMDNRNKHFGIGYKTLEDGFFESGVELNRIFKGFGISGFYRYGPNQLPRFEDNVSVKVSFIINIGI